MITLVLAALVGGAPVQAGAPLPRGEISFRARTIGVVCTGVCPHFELTVGRDGSVTERWFGAVDKRNEEEGTLELKRFRISRAEAAGFFAALAPLRPVGHRRFGQPCDAKYPADSGVRRGLSEYEIRWRGRGAADYLEACFSDAPVRRATSLALLQLRIAPSDGSRLSAADARNAAVCWKRNDGFC